jgi:hypothetical protein
MDSRRYARASRLPMKDFFQVVDVATKPERMALEKLLVRKRNAAGLGRSSELIKPDPCLSKWYEKYTETSATALPQAVHSPARRKSKR